MVKLDPISSSTVKWRAAKTATVVTNLHRLAPGLSCA